MKTRLLFLTAAILPILGSSQVEITTATSEEKEGIRANLSLPSHRFNQLYQKINDAATNGVQPALRVMVMGDSIRRQYAEPYWYGKFGLGGRICVPSDSTDGYVTLASGTTVAATDNTQWTSNWWTLPVSGTITANLYNLQSTTAEVYYFRENGAGTFKLQWSDNGSAYADISGGTVDAHTAGARTLTKFTVTINSSFSQSFSIRAVGVNTGTNPAGSTKIIGLGGFNSASGTRPKGVTTWDIGLGGSEPSQWVSMPQADFTTALQGFAPDVIFIRGWETLVQWQTHFPTLVSRIRTALPRVDIVVVGRTPTDTEPGLEDTDQDRYLRGYCHANDIYFIDVKRHLPNRADMISRGWMTAPDGVHLTESGMRACDQVVQAYLPFLWGAPPLWWKLVGNVPQPHFLNGIRGSNNSEFIVQGFTNATRGSLGFVAGTGNNAANLNISTALTGIGRLRAGTDSFHDGTLGFYQAGTLAGMMRPGRLWIGTGANSDRGTDKNINAGLMVQAPATNVTAAAIGGISGQTSPILTLNRGMSQSLDGAPIWTWLPSGNMEYEGTTADAFEATIATQEPTVDATITIPTKNTGTVCVFLGTLADPPAGTISTGAIYVDNNGGDTNAVGTWLYTGSAWTQLN